MYTIPIISIKTNPDAGKQVCYRPVGKEYEYVSLVKYPQYAQYLQMVQSDSESLTRYTYLSPIKLLDIDKTQCVKYEFRQNIETIRYLHRQSKYIVKYNFDIEVICNHCGTIQKFNELLNHNSGHPRDSFYDKFDACANCLEDECCSYQYESIEEAIIRGVKIDE